jgi:RND superfamily putative drug exporter
MSELLARVARTLASHWKRSLAAACGVLVLLVLAAGAGGEAKDDYSVPGAESQKAIDLFQAHSPAFGGADSTLVFTVDRGKVSDPAPKAAIEGALAEVRRLDGVALVASPFAQGGQVSEDGRLASVDVRYSTDPAQIKKEDGEALIAAGETAEPEVQVEARGYLIDLASEQDAPVGELLGVLIAIVLLTLLFRSGWAMGATLIGALIGVMAGQLLLAALSAPLGLPTFASVIAMMLGLGAGIDYALLIIGRYREQRAAGDTVQDAAARAGATAGTTVVAAGVIVMVAIAGLLVIGVPYIGKMGLGAALAIGAVVVSALTVLPIMIGAFGRRLVPRRPEHVQASPAFARWGERVTRRPWVSIAAGVAVLLVFAFPVTQMRLGQPDDGNQPESRTSASPTTSSPPRSARARTGRSCSPSTRRRARRRPSGSSARSSGRSPRRRAWPPCRRRRSARTARWRRSSRRPRPRPRTPGPPTCSSACARTSSRGRPPARRSRSTWAATPPGSWTSPTRSPRACRCSSPS